MKAPQYITLAQLMASVEADFDSYANNAMIDRGKVIKVVRHVNADIGLKINTTKEIVLDVENFKADLPVDFKFLQLAVICEYDGAKLGGIYSTVGNVFGTHTEETSIIPTNMYNNYGACLNEQGGCYWVTQKYKEKTVQYNKLKPIRLSKKALTLCSSDCPNKSWDDATYELDIQNEEIITNFRTGKIFISYIADMLSENGEILVLNHEMVIPYYEYAIKKSLLENWMINKDADVANIIPYIKQELKEARIKAINFINTLEYTEIMDVMKTNRIRFYNRYEKMFNDVR